MMIDIAKPGEDTCAALGLVNFGARLLATSIANYKMDDDDRTKSENITNIYAAVEMIRKGAAITEIAWSDGAPDEIKPFIEECKKKVDAFYKERKAVLAASGQVAILSERST